MKVLLLILFLHLSLAAEIELFDRNALTFDMGRIAYYTPKKLSYYRYTICDEQFDLNDAIVICRMLGFRYAEEAYLDSFFGKGSGPVYLTNLSCIGFETDITQCDYDRLTDENSSEYCLSHEHDASVKCNNYKDPYLDLEIARTPDNALAVNVDSKWTLVCSNLNYYHLMRVACKQLYLNPQVVNITSPTIEVGGLMCSGYESNIGRCPRKYGFHSNELLDCDTAERMQCSIKGLNYSQPYRLFDLQLRNPKVENSKFEGILYMYSDEFNPGRWFPVCYLDEEAVKPLIQDANKACYQLHKTSACSLTRVEKKNGTEVAFIFFNQGNRYLEQNQFSINKEYSYFCKNLIYITCFDQEGLCLRNGSTDIRLVQGFDDHNHTGRLQVYYNGQFGSVCSHDFHLTDASVACRSMGFEAASMIIPPPPNINISAEEPIFLDYVRCYGHETSLSQCGHKKWGETGCTHSSDVWLECDSSLPVTTPSNPFRDLIIMLLVICIGSILSIFIIGISIFLCQWRQMRARDARKLRKRATLPDFFRRSIRHFRHDNPPVHTKNGSFSLSSAQTPSPDYEFPRDYGIDQPVILKQSST